MSKASEQHTSVTSSRSGTTDSIRHMLREQKKHCSSLHANPLFQEFWHRSKPPQDAQPPVIDDLEAEGQTRLFEVIRTAAEVRETDRAGVWASFGQPYACLGQPQQLDTSAAALLPHLNRDDIDAAAAGAKQQTQQQMQRRGGMRLSRTGSAGPTAGAIAAAASALAAAAALDGKAPATAGSLHHTSNSTSNQADKAKLLHHKTVMHFNTVDRLEASFPKAAVRQADKRQKAAKVKPRRFFNKSRAEQDLADAAASYGHHALPVKALPGKALLQQHQTAAAAVAAQHAARDAPTSAAAAAARHSHSKGPAATSSTAGAPDAAATGAGDGRQAFFITQQAPGAAATASGAAAAGVAAGEDGPGAAAPASTAAARRMSVSMSADIDAAHYGGHRASVRASDTFPDPQATGSAAHDPAFGPLTDLTMQPLEGSSSPVITWHNDFVGVRQAGYAGLQQTLWQRSQDRARARGEPAAGALFSKGLLQQLDQAGGRFMPGWIPGTTYDSPFTLAMSQQQQQQQQQSQAGGATAASAETAAAARPSLKPAEVELLEQFYEALCSLVERLRLSDPLSLTLVHKVKALLEGGTFLQPAMLQGCVDCVADFSTSCGLQRYNRFLLPLLTFVRKCTGVSQADFDAMVAAAGLKPVIYDQASVDAAQAGGPASLQQQQEQQQQQQLLLAVVPEDAEVLAGPEAPCHTRPVTSSGGGSSSRPQTSDHPPSSAGAASAAPPSPGRASTAGSAQKSPDLRLERCTSSATAPATGRASCVSGSGGSSSSRGGSCSGASTGRARHSSAAAAKVVSEGPSLPGITAAAVAAAADIAAAIHSAPESQRALAAAGAGSGATSSSIQVKVPGVAGPVELVSAQAAAAAAAAQAAGGADGDDARAADADSPDDAAAAAEEVLPDLGLDEEGQPLSRRLKHQEGLATWAGAAVPAARAASVPSPAEGDDAVDFEE